jgi:glucose/arabinose dehydrogenase
MKPLIASVFLFCAGFLSFGQTPTPVSVSLSAFITGLSNPICVRHCGDDRVFILEKNSGIIKVYHSQTGAFISNFLNVGSLISTGSERGLLGLAFHPNYAENGYFYINYTNTQGHTVIRRYSVSANPNVADASSGLTILTITQPFSNHNGGDLLFGPDGYLYIPTGDGGSANDPQNNSQNNNSMLGKVLRIDVDNGSPYSIPPTNPFVNTPGVLNEIWATGLRNPWRNAFDPLTGDFWTADVGQNAWEEINFQPASSPGGENYGWRCYEGNAAFNTSGCLPIAAFTFPVAVFSHGAPYNYCSITGGTVYRGSGFPGLWGHYLFTDYCEGRIRSLKSNSQGGFSEHLLLNNSVGGYVDFGTDSNGELYLTRINNGTVYKISEACGSFNPQISSTGTGSLQASPGAGYWWFLNGQIIPGATSQTFIPTQSGAYTCMIQNASGCTRESNAITWFVTGGIPGCTYPNAVNFSSEAEVDDGSCEFLSTCEDCLGDFNNDGLINFSDLSLFLSLYGGTCP